MLEKEDMKIYSSIFIIPLIFKGVEKVVATHLRDRLEQ